MNNIVKISVSVFSVAMGIAYAENTVTPLTTVESLQAESQQTTKPAIGHHQKAKTTSALKAREPVQTAKATKEKLLALLSQFTSFSADFTQQVKDEQGLVIQEGQGYFKLAKPHHLLWQTTQPDESTIIADGETLWLYDPFIEQATAYSFEQSIHNTPILLLMNNEQTVWDQYLISEITSVSNTKQQQYVITSTNEDSQVKTLTLTFAERDFVGFTITDVTGQTSEFSLSGVNLSPQITSETFTFTLPQGAVLDDQR